VFDELVALADFLEVSQERVHSIMGELFEQPPSWEQTLRKDEIPAEAAFHEGHLLELHPKHLVEFEEALSEIAQEEYHGWRRLTRHWTESNFPLLVELARPSALASTPPLALTTLLKGPFVHEAGLCRPCLFAPKGSCQFGDLCMYCHLPGHVKKNRKSKNKRDRKKGKEQAVGRTPSASPERTGTPDFQTPGTPGSGSPPALEPFPVLVQHFNAGNAALWMPLLQFRQY